MRRMTPNQLSFFAFLLLALILAGCNYPGTPTPDLFPTFAAQTVESRLTQSAGTTPILPPPTNTEAAPPPTTEVPVTPTHTSTPIPTQTTTPCNRAAFVSDVTVPDGTSFAANASFTKTWRLKNAGTCTWNSSYSLVFDDGSSMNGPATKALTGTVAPGQTVDISVDLKAPGSSGSYRGYWKLRSDAGILFGVGSAGDVAFWVDIKVGSGGDTVVYNFVSRYCDAQWVSGAGNLSCPGTTGDSEGFVVKVNNPKLETGSTDDEPALETHPEWDNDGVITGRFPAFDVESGDHFKAVIGCLYNGTACDVRFQLNYRANGGSLQNLGQWDEIYDGAIRKLDIDLSSLAGKSVEFVLAVQAHGASSQDWAFWLLPRIVR
jgi:hypothetical protein